jgi:hypothetical protein
MMTIVKFCGAATASKSGLIIHYRTYPKVTAQEPLEGEMRTASRRERRFVQK